MTGRFTSICFAGLCLLFSSLPVIAADDEEYALDRKSYDSLTSARELMQEEAYTRALEILEKLLATDIKPYDRAVTYQTLGYIYISMNDYPAAIESFTQALEGGYLPVDVIHQLNFTMAQLLIQQARYQEGINYLEKWLQDEPGPDKQAWLLAASAYYQLEAYDKMIPMVQKAIAASDKPDQSLYEMLLAGYFQTGNFSQAGATLEDMIKLFPEKDEYWLQLATSYHRMENYKKALAIYEIAKTRGILDKDRMLQLARLYLNGSLPYKAGKLLEEQIDNGTLENSIENLEMLANSWLLAKEYEKAVSVLKELADRQQDPQIYYRIGRISFEQDNWQKAVDAFERAIKNDLKENVAEAHLLLGISAFKLKNNTVSARALTEASGYDSTREQASWWLNQLSRRMEKQSEQS